MPAIDEWSPHLAVIDKFLGLEDVMECLRTLRDSPGAPRAVIWATSISGAEAVRLLRAGAAGVIRKTAPLNVLMQCIESVAKGASWIEDGVIGSTDAKPIPARRTLTRRELEIVELVERGMSNKAIAAELGIRVGTVKIHLRHIFEKTGIHGRYGVALSGLRSKLPPGAAPSPVFESTVRNLA